MWILDEERRYIKCAENLHVVSDLLKGFLTADLLEPNQRLQLTKQAFLFKYFFSSSITLYKQVISHLVGIPPQ
jgi:hypothetical protein